MKWIRHMTNSRRDFRLRSLILKHGAEAYAVYWIAVEIIAENLDTNLKCLIEHDLDGLADETGSKPEKIKIILDESVKLGLFTKKCGKYQNLKILNYSDEWTRKKLRINSGDSPEKLQPEGKGREGKRS